MMGSTSTSFFFLQTTPFRIRQFQVCHRPKSKSTRVGPAPLRNLLEPSSSEFLTLVAHNWVPPAAALAFTSALALSLSLSFSNTKTPDPEPDPNRMDEWFLFASPTSFNRFVLLRCPSIILQDDLDDLVKGQREFLTLDAGAVRVVAAGAPQVEYQRVCVGTPDGGVVSLDWPAELDLTRQDGFDTTVVVVPGTAEGSTDVEVKRFVGECLRRGLFPVVMNPRGCGDSPLTTPRLFTAADSDDVCSAIQFITRARPWSTLMGVGWGYGANMLTKYLAEAGEKTPLTAATCIDNPFDLEEATKTSPNDVTINKMLLGGLIDILNSNKELFQGRRKGFDLEKALSAESVRDFEEAISMISYGFDSIEEFYSSSSTRSLVGKLKIPVLFIQTNDGTAPAFSIPRGLIAENPFTNLLLCSPSPSNFCAIPWYHQVTIEWLAAVELGLLKGRHPLLQDVDVTINPSKSLALVEGRMLATNGGADIVMNPAESDSPDAHMDYMSEIVRKNDDAAYIQFESNKFLEGRPDSNNEASSNNCNNSVEANSLEDAKGSMIESDKGQVIQTTKVVMNLLDATMPGTLKEEEKKKVLEAVERGETLMKALQDVVPEEVRGKLTSSVSEILQAQEKNLKFDGLARVSQLAKMSSGLRSKIKEKSGNPDVTTEGSDHILDGRASDDDVRNSNDHQGDVDEHAGVANGSQSHQRPANSDIPEPKAVNKIDDNVGSTKASSNSIVGEDVSDVTAKISSSSSNNGGTDCLETGAQSDRSNDVEVTQPDDKGSYPKVVSDRESIKTGTPAVSELSDASGIPASSITEGQPSEKIENDSKRSDEKTMQPPPDQNSGSVSSNLALGVSQALDALTGLDDSTQAAVNGVFGVIENMLAQLEEKQIDSIVKNENEKNNTNSDSMAEKSHIDSEIHLEKQIDGDDKEDANPLDVENVNGYISNPMVENNPTSLASTKNTGKKSPTCGKLVARNPGMPANISKLLFYISLDPFTKAFYSESLRKYILPEVQKMKSSSLDVDATSGLFLDFNPAEGRWLLQGQPEDIHDIGSNNNRNKEENGLQLTEGNVMDNIIEPSYVILDGEKQGERAEELEKLDNLVQHDLDLEKSKNYVKTVLLNSLRVEVSRRLSATAMKAMAADLEADMEHVAKIVFLAFQYGKGRSGSSIQDNQLSQRHFVEAISQAVQNTIHLKRVLPVGVIVGSSLAALRNFFDVSGLHDLKNTSPLANNVDHINGLEPAAKPVQEAKQLPTYVDNHDSVPAKSFAKQYDDVPSSATKTLNGNTFMVGAVTAALGASAVLGQQEVLLGSDSSGITSNQSKGNHVKTESTNDKEVADYKSSNIVTSLAEKAMSVAAPIVPTKEGGEVDQERLVAMLAELGQKGGLLKLVGKLALLWGGLRGAMSLTDRLISFLRVAEKPLWQRVLGFYCMTLVLWSPVLVPLLPTLFHNWATKNSSRFVELACILGLYSAVTILITQWGKRIRGHEYPLKQYGLDFRSPKKLQNFCTGFVGGVILVMSIQSVNARLGFTKLSWPLQLISSSLDLTTKLKAYGQLVLLAAQGFLTAAGIAFVEELLFRSWLLEEIAADLGYRSAILLSALVFSLTQRSLVAIPGLWLLSLALAGARLRNQGNLFIPIGMRTGIIVSNFILQMGGFMTQQPKKSPLWIGRMHLSQPFSGVVGLFFALVLAVILYPRRPGFTTKSPRPIRP